MPARKGPIAAKISTFDYYQKPLTFIPYLSKSLVVTLIGEAIIKPMGKEIGRAFGLDLGVNTLYLPREVFSWVNPTESLDESGKGLENFSLFDIEWSKATASILFSKGYHFLKQNRNTLAFAATLSVTAAIANYAINKTRYGRMHPFIRNATALTAGASLTHLTAKVSGLPLAFQDTFDIILRTIATHHLLSKVTTPLTMRVCRLAFYLTRPFTTPMAYDRRS